MDTIQFAALAGFRSAAYAAFGRRRDALFELCDTLLTTGPVPSLPFLSVQPQHQRKWGSLYDALAVGQIRSSALEQLLTSHPLAGSEPIYAVDVSVWPRCDAPDQPRTGHLFSRLAAFGWAAHRRRLGLLLARSSEFRPGSTGRAGPLPCAFGGCSPRRMPPPSLRSRSPPSFPCCRALVCCHGSSSRPVTTRCSCPRRSVTLAWRCSCACAPGAVSTLTPPHSPGPAGRVGMATNSPVIPPQTWLPPAGDLTLEDAPYGRVRVRAWSGLRPGDAG
jgi:hypothetical protein